MPRHFTFEASHVLQLFNSLDIDREIYEMTRKVGTIISSVCLKNSGRNRQRKFLPYRCSETPLEKCKRRHKA